ncbi:MAG: hypothetical protein R3F07_08110 [Opitutaceae bacterium]
MSRLKRRTVEVFSMSFLDCISCGFGAVLLLFVITSGKKADVSEKEIGDLQTIAQRMAVEVTIEEDAVKKLEDTTADNTSRVKSLEDARTELEKKMANREEILALLMLEQSTLEDELKKRMEEKENIPTVEEPPPIPVPNIERRQYLTGFKLNGDRVLFLVEASGGMLDDTVDGAIARQGDPEYEKRKAPKWQRVIRSILWMINSLPAATKYQILYFNEETLPILPDRDGEWLAPADRESSGEVVQRLDLLVPKGGANLERAFTVSRDFKYAADSIVLFVDGLPTLSDTYPGRGSVADRDRERMFRAAMRRLPPRIPVNTILYPMTGDPAAAMLFWELSNETRGALVSPARSWPDT